MSRALALICLPLLAGQAFGHGGGKEPAMQQMWQKSLARKPLAAGAAFAPDGRLWRATVNQGAIELAVSADFGQQFSAPFKVNPQPEAIAADGENRPQLAFGPQGEIAVGWVQSLPQPFSGHARFSWSKDGGRSWSAVQTINDDPAPISHRFLALDWGSQGLTAVWLDGRDKAAARDKLRDYSGAAVYSARFDPVAGRFGANLRLADHSCECCRTVLAHDPDGTPVELWRHVFPGGIRDHAILRLDGVAALQRASFDQWKIDACPHHGPGMSIDEAGVRHLVWFNQRPAAQWLSYARQQPDASQPEEVTGFGNPEAQAGFPAVVAAGKRVALAWKEFDGRQTTIRVQQSADSGLHWNPPVTLASSTEQAERPQLLRWQQRLFLVWNHPASGLLVRELPAGAP